MPGLAAMHTVWHREHNRIAYQLQTDYGMTDDEEIYQFARRLVGAEMQNVIYGQWLTAVLGESKMNESKLTLENRSNYDSSEDPSIFNSFATAAFRFTHFSLPDDWPLPPTLCCIIFFSSFRFGHTLIQGTVQMLTVPGGCMSSTYELRDAFFNMSNYFLDNGQGMERILFGLLHQESQAHDQFFTEDVTNFLRANDSLPRDDLVTRNIQRAREHGLPGYNDFRSFCSLPISCNWDTPPEGVTAEKWSQLQMLYDNPGAVSYTHLTLPTILRV